jgi:hypothetical protein
VDNIFFLIFRRMRAPLLALIVTYSVAMAGLVLIPGATPTAGRLPRSSTPSTSSATRRRPSATARSRTRSPTPSASG